MKNMNADQFMFIKISVLYDVAADAVTNEASVLGILVSERSRGNDIRAHLLREILSLWQDECAATENNTTRAVKASVRVWQSSFSSIWRQEAALVGYTHLMRAWLFVTRRPGTCLVYVSRVLHFSGINNMVGVSEMSLRLYFFLHVTTCVVASEVLRCGG
jgi:hypothetical protein